MHISQYDYHWELFPSGSTSAVAKVVICLYQRCSVEPRWSSSIVSEWTTRRKWYLHSPSCDGLYQRSNRSHRVKREHIVNRRLFCHAEKPVPRAVERRLLVIRLKTDPFPHAFEYYAFGLHPASSRGSHYNPWNRDLNSDEVLNRVDTSPPKSMASDLSVI